MPRLPPPSATTDGVPKRCLVSNPQQKKKHTRVFAVLCVCVVVSVFPPPMTSNHNPLDSSQAVCQILERVRGVGNPLTSGVSSSLLSSSSTLATLAKDASIVPGSVLTPYGPWAGAHQDEALMFLNTKPLSNPQGVQTTQRAPPTDSEVQNFNALLDSSIARYLDITAKGIK